MSSTTEVAATAGGTFKVVADASLKAAYKRANQEDTPMALEIVRDCMEIAKSTSPPDDPELAQVADYERQVDEALARWRADQVEQTPEIKPSTSSARPGEHVTVTGRRFWAHEIVDIRVHSTLVAQVRSDDNGTFTAVVTVPTTRLNLDFDTVITAAGRTSSRWATAPFHVAP
jgi:hypothetical protein